MYSLADENVVTRGSQKSNSVSYNERSTRLAKSKQGSDVLEEYNA